MKQKEAEIWKDVIGYEKLYQVSNFGRVKSLTRLVKNRIFKGRILKPNIVGKGYLAVDLCKEGKRNNKHIHIMENLNILGYILLKLKLLLRIKVS